MSRDIPTITIDLSTAGDRRPLNARGHCLRLIDAPSGFRMTFFPNFAGGKGISFLRGGGWVHSAFDRMFASWPAMPGKTATVAYYGQTSEEKPELFELYEGQAVGAMEITNLATSPANFILRTTAGDAFGLPPDPVATKTESADSTGAFWKVGSHIVRPNDWNGVCGFKSSSGTAAGTMVLGGSAVPAGKRWLVHSLLASFTGSATNGGVHLVIKDNLGNIKWYKRIPHVAGTSISQIDAFGFLGASAFEMLAGWSIEYTCVNTSQFSIAASYLEF